MVTWSGLLHSSWPKIWQIIEVLFIFFGIYTLAFAVGAKIQGKKQNKIATGFPSSMKMAGGSSNVDQMIAGTERGILVTRLWYLREVDPRTILYTGLTRDGTFLIENGKIAKSVQNFRFNESPLFMLNNLEALGKPERLAGTEQGGAVVMPSLKVRDFNFTSLSEAV